ncbi:hypothetical protein ZOSMA_79G00080 [Zostera marina]|uniref:DUF538 family protein n=1 Tax=Zostera marina TaxID=29655 RepID=A0A0K9NQ27_ZOSMR|nr:hypothetical protein ZOSMA_79G00080 [Zostera marina]
MPPFFPLPFVLFVSLSFSLARPMSMESGDRQKTVYDVLNENGLPMGLFPKGIERFGVDEEGNFHVFLEKVCTAKFENEVRYETNVTGTISYGQITSLKGISSQELFLWFPVKMIRVDIPNSGIIYFDVGVIYKQFSFSLFEIPPECEDAVVSDRDVHDDKKIAEILSKVQAINFGQLRSSVVDTSMKAIQ